MPILLPDSSPPSGTGWRAVRFVRKHPATAFTLLRMTMWVGVVSLAFKFCSLPRVLKIVEPRLRHRPSDGGRDVQEGIARLLDWLLATNFWFLTPTCWKRAPVLHRFLALKGIQTKVLFGVRRDEEKQLDGHVWLEAEGVPLLEHAEANYKVTYSYP